MIKFNNLSLRRGSQLLFEGVSLDIHDAEKIGLTGDNGSGKSSLFSAMLGEINIDQGDLELPQAMRVSHVAQQTPSDARSALDHVLDGDTEFRKTQKALAELDQDKSEEKGANSAMLYGRMEEIDGYSAPARAAKLLSGLGFKTDTHDNPSQSFSGGWRVRMNLAKALMAPSDLLLLDEPTNHLDLDAIVWLEDWLKKYEGTLMLISHDRDFIDGCCRRILHIENQGIRSYSGNYSQFERQRAERLANEQSIYEKQKKKVAHMESFIRRFRYKASKAKQAQSRIKALEKMQMVIPAHLGSPFNFKFKQCDRLSDPILKLENADAGYGENVVLNNVNLSLSGGERIGLLGANGAGKSTLIKVMADELALMRGDRLQNRNLKIGYFAQHQLEQLDSNLTPMKQFQRQFPKATTQELRRFLGGFDFKGTRVDEPIGPFSGGEKARLALALIIYAGPNILLLDEPTNHLDMEMRHALSLAMQDFEGAIILVSHDRSLINRVTDRLILIRDGRVEDFNQDMAEYLRLLRQSSAKGAEKPVHSSDPRASTPVATKKQRRQILADRRQKIKPVRDRVKTMEKELEQLQQKIDQLDAILHDPQTYETESTANLSAMMQQKSDLEKQLQQTENAWYETMGKLEQMESELPN